MVTQQIRFYKAEKTLGKIGQHEVVFVSLANVRDGSFSKPITKALESAEQVLAHLATQSKPRADILIKIANGGWQGWLRRRNAGRWTPPGAVATMGKKSNLGTGCIYVQR